MKSIRYLDDFVVAVQARGMPLDECVIVGGAAFIYHGLLDEDSNGDLDFVCSRRARKGCPDNDLVLAGHVHLLCEGTFTFYGISDDAIARHEWLSTPSPEGIRFETPEALFLSRLMVLHGELEGQTAHGAIRYNQIRQFLVERGYNGELVGPLMEGEIKQVVCDVEVEMPPQRVVRAYDLSRLNAEVE